MMRDLVGRFRNRAKHRTLNAVANAAVARTWDQAADEIEQYLSGNGSLSPGDVSSLPVIEGTAAKPTTAANRGQRKDGKRPTRAERVEAQRQAIRIPAYKVIRRAGREVEGADIVTALRAQGMDIDLRRLLPILHAGVRDKELIRDKTRYRPGEFFKA